ncbi:hypothetical protein QWY31_11505 [Cytophagales bacterium LB-30]|uniref:Alginate export domain-containing protein n=1 Tax=Shiella aurantiaca TaxID=3058365 RepID=A0ABT8F6N7_9BACT|nr:hypothetical protein [Shiella aurantiaca]MDN4166132.1 hypothetical protein [Shiella aurantiaca]
MKSLKATYLFLFLFGMIGLNLETQAQDAKVSAHYRINPLHSRGFRDPLNPGEKPGFYTMQISRLNLELSNKGDLSAGLSIQDRRFWGDESTRDDKATVTIYRAWVQKHFTEAFSVKLGRQDLIYNDNYLMGERAWVGTLAHDVAKVIYEKNGFKAHLVAGVNTKGGELDRDLYLGINNYKNMQFLWLHKDFKKLSSSFILQNLGFENADSSLTVYNMQNIGTHNELTISNSLSLTAFYYHQLGKNGKNQNVDAYYYSAQLTYTPIEPLSITAATLVSSGDSQNDYEDPTNTRSRYHDKPFFNGHEHFGLMDYFFFKNNTYMGVNDYFFKVEYQVNPKLKITNTTHEFFTNQVMNNELNQAMDKNLGIENDLLIAYKVSNGLKVTLGHSIMFGTDTFQQFTGGKTITESQYFYAVIVANPVFFQSKKDN